ncbi:MAG: ribonucleoside-diphosphate reductase, adenosylcobalamin-dependent, ribonucleoside-diphosphate [Candidatus Berkelbacteria bacterium]|nr:ribonucleoside-diphosphate reductase, adenosylcobalamin-dependent, ribonucleoside-diphosphate [Candidatus Berkelbacteria bacterium]
MSSELLKPEKVMIVPENDENLFDSSKKFRKEEKITTLKDLQNELIQPQFSKNALEILQKRYLAKEEGEENETAKDLLVRVASTIAQTGQQYGTTDAQILSTAKKFYESMARLEFFPNSPTLRGAGRRIHQLAACFVIPIPDSMEGIFDALKTTALVHKGGGGTGFSFGRLRPSGDKVGSTGGVAGGPLSFMHIFDTMASEVMQGGVRVGANMGILPVWHPDIEKWITAKADNKSFLNFNLSVAATDEFMEKIEDNKEFDLINPRTNQKTGTLRAGDTFDLIIQNAWKNGDPGLIFIDKINKDNPTPEIGEIESTNPCGEQPLLPHESCNLGSINLSQMTRDGQVDWDRLKKTTHTAVQFMDNVIDANRYFVPDIEKMTKGNRKIGLGVMGFADMLVQLGIAYNSEAGIKLAEKVMKFVQDEGIKESEALAITRGPFPNISKSIFKNKTPRRNATVTTIAPTGTLSLLGGCAGGIEPFFAIVIRKKSIWKQDGTSELEQIYVNPVFEKVAQKDGWYSDELIDKISSEASIKDFEEIPQNVRKIFVTAHDISPEWHIKMQAAFQKYTDNAVSKTINFPSSATIDDIKNAYLLSYSLNCKGLTVYRDGSRENQVLSTVKKEVPLESEPEKLVASGTVKIVPRERPDIIHGFTYRIKTAYGKLFVTINDDENGQAFEIFSHLGKAGGFFAAKAEAICRLISLSLRSGIDSQEIVDQLKGIRGPTPTWSEDGSMILSLPDAIAKILEKHISKEQTKLDLEYKTAKQPKLDAIDTGIAEENLAMSNGFSPKPKVSSLADYGEAPACPECGGMLELGEGCLKCNFCGYSKCS